MPMFDPAWEVKKDLFPNAHTTILGGCVIDEDSPTYGYAQICDACIVAEEEWRKVDPENRGRL